MSFEKITYLINKLRPNTKFSLSEAYNVKIIFIALSMLKILFYIYFKKGIIKTSFKSLISTNLLDDNESLILL